MEDAIKVSHAPLVFPRGNRFAQSTGHPFGRGIPIMRAVQLPAFDLRRTLTGQFDQPLSFAE
jgi:hypothetical protein